MSKQITVRIPDELAEKLAARAASARRKRADIVRLALEDYLERPSLVREVEAPYQRAMRLKLLGTIDSGIPDLGSKHDEYLEKMGFGREDNIRK